MHDNLLFNYNYGVLTGCGTQKNENKATFGCSGRQITVNAYTKSIDLKNVGLYNYYNKTKNSSVSGRGTLHSNLNNGTAEMTFTLGTGRTYSVKVIKSSNQIKVNYKKGDYYDTYNKK